MCVSLEPMNQESLIMVFLSACSYSGKTNENKNRVNAMRKIFIGRMRRQPLIQKAAKYNQHA